MDPGMEQLSQDFIYKHRSIKKDKIRVYNTADHVILQNEGESLWCSKDTGSMKPILSAMNEGLNAIPYLEGTTYGVIGKLRFFEDSDWHLLLIDQIQKIGLLPQNGGAVYCIEKVSLVPLTLMKTSVEVNIESYFLDKKEKEMKDRDKLEKKLKEALLQMFNGSQSFYFSLDTDLTQSMQRQHDYGDGSRIRPHDKVDDRFFWNKHMIADLLKHGQEADSWIIPVVQGFIEIREIPIPSAENLGVFKKYCTKDKLIRMPLELNMSSYTMVEKEGDNYVSRSYCSETDSNEMQQLSSNGDYFNEPPRNLSFPISNPNLKSTCNPNEERTHSVIMSVDPTGSPEEVCVLYSDNVIDSHRTSPEDKTTMNTDVNIFNPLSNWPTHKSHESICSFDTDELINEEIEHEKKQNDFRNVAPHLHVSTNEDDHICESVHSTTGMSGEVKLSPDGTPLLTLAIISRRSRHRAGTRYLRRGVDEDGHVANYVETELIAKVHTHLLSFTIVRGSVPVFWTQSGQKYRPDPVIQRTESETTRAFESHFQQQINLYQEQVIVSLINQSGRERPVGEAYEKQLLSLDCPLLTYVAFDFHHHCKVNQWHNINLLLDNIEEYINRQHYFWYSYSDDTILCQQRGVFRVNCVDCLDRTNVVQSVISREVLQTALQKLGLLCPFDSITGNFLKHYQEIWANNGDTISKQYTGTAAMKGDLTRYGQRKIYGVMKDGYNSAHRFILSLFRDAYRQVIIDLQQGVPPSEALLSLPDSQKALTGIIDDNGPVITRRSILSYTWTTDREELITEMIRLCIDQLYPYNPTIPIQGWVLLEALGYSFVKGSVKEEETVLLLSSERGHVCVANYNAEFQHVSCCIRIPLDKIERIVIGQIGSILRSSPRLHMRLFYSLFPNVSCYFTFRTVYSVSPEEDKCILLGIAQAITTLKPQIPIQESKLSKKTSPAHEGIVYLIPPDEWMVVKKCDTAADLQSPVSPSIGSDNSSMSNSNSNISYVPLTSNEHKTLCYHGHSRQSSIASSQIGLITNQTYDFNSDDTELSYSAPNSPNLRRRTSIMSLEERSRLFSHSSMDDFTMVQKQNFTENDLSFKELSYSYSDADDNSDSDYDEDLHHQRMSSVLSTQRRCKIADKLNDIEVIPLQPLGIKNEDNVLMENMKTLESTACDSQENINESKQHVVENDFKLSGSASLSQHSTNGENKSSNFSTSTGGGWYLSRLKGKLFSKVRPMSASATAIDDIEGAGMTSKSQSIGKTKIEKKRTINNAENEAKNIFQHAMQASKTRFIII